LGRSPALSTLYRYLPNNRAQRPGALQEGGKLQALAIQAHPLFNIDLAKTGDRLQVVWASSRARASHTTGTRSS